MDFDNSSTISDVAKLAGVSKTTVSRYINSSGYVEEKTRAKIKNAIDILDFKPSKIARSLKTKRTNKIMLVVPDICNPFYSSMYKSVQDVAEKSRCSVILYNTNENKDNETKAVEMFEEIKADGIIFCSIDINNKVIDYLKSISNNVVVSNLYENPVFDAVHTSKGNGIYLSTRHLIGLGHSNIAYAGGAKGSIINESRKRNYLQALNEASIPFKEDFCFEMAFSMDSGYKAGKYFLSLTNRPTAICAANDLIAMGIMYAFNESGIRIPEDISLTGMDNIDFAALSRPGLTTITNNSTYYGKSAAGLLFERIEKIYEGAPREIIVPHELIIRGSTRIL